MIARCLVDWTSPQTTRKACGRKARLLNLEYITKAERFYCGWDFKIMMGISCKNEVFDIGWLDLKRFHSDE